MQYNKPFLTFEQQAGLILSRGLIADRDVLVSRLKCVSYYRLSGYLYPYRLANDNFRPGTTLEQVWRHYTFDRRLRLIVMDAIERFEISFRTQIAYLLAKDIGPFGYTNPSNFPNMTSQDHTNLILNKISEEQNKSKDKFVEHFKNKYGDSHNYLPIWMASEIMTFRLMINIYLGVSDETKQNIAQYYNIPDSVLTSWLNTISVIRNICAHHSRLWNRVLGVKPKLPYEKYPDWHNPFKISNDRVFGILTILYYLLKITASQSQWYTRFLNLFEQYSEINKSSMGFPANWKDSPLWK